MPSRAYHKIDTFVVKKDEWDTKEGRGKSMKNGFYVPRYVSRVAFSIVMYCMAKGTSQAEVTLNSEKD